MDEQIAVDLLDGVEARHPLEVMVLEAVHVCLLSAVEQPGRLEGGSARTGVDGGVAEPLGAQQQQCSNVSTSAVATATLQQKPQHSGSAKGFLL